MDAAPAGAAAAAPVNLFRIARGPGQHSLVLSAAQVDFSALRPGAADALLVSAAVDRGVSAEALVASRSSLGAAVRACSSAGAGGGGDVAAAVAAALRPALAAAALAVQLVRVPLPPRALAAAALWVALLPEAYDQDGLAALYGALKAAAAAAWPVAASGSTRGGALVMPLIGKHPSRGVHAPDVVQELLSFAEHCGHAAPGLASVTLVSSQPDSFGAALAELRRPEHALLLAPQLPAHLGALAAAAASPALPPALRWPCELIVTAGQLCAPGAAAVAATQAPGAAAAARTALFASTCCLQARTMLDWLLTQRCGQEAAAALPCGHWPGGEQKLRRAHAAGALSEAQLALGRAINRHGNKAAHSATQEGLTLTDCNCVLSALLTLLRDFRV
jgi:hypothetical protein